MTAPDSTEVSRVLAAIGEGDRQAAAELLPFVYEELRRLANRRMARESGSGTLQPTALVHEAYLRLVGDGDAGWESRGHFFAAAAEAMRRILVDRARKRRRIKHGGGRVKVPLSEGNVAAPEKSVDLVVLDEALHRIEKEDRRASQVVMLRVFVGLSIEDTAKALGVSPMTVKRDWAFARAWLYNELHGGEALRGD